MEGMIFIGIQASGKSTFYIENFFDSHLRISMDLLNTRNKEKQFLDKCFELHQKVVIDNTNPQKSDRSRYIELFKENKYKVIGYYFQSSLKSSLEKNQLRKGKKRIPDVGVIATHQKLELPSYEEGFDQLFYVSSGNNQFRIQEWKNEI